MGKTTCEVCKKRCKGHAIKLSEKSYVHMKCFICKKCQNPLPPEAFFTHNNEHYCSKDYKQLFGPKCYACGKPAEGEVMTILGNTYHQTCTVCSKCGQNVSAGSKVTLAGKDLLCQACMQHLRQVDSASPEKCSKEIISESNATAPADVSGVSISTKRPQEIPSLQSQLNSPDSDFAYDMKDESTVDGDLSTNPHLLSMTSPTSDYKSYLSDVSDKVKESPGDMSHNHLPNGAFSDSPNDSHSFGRTKDVLEGVTDFGKFYQTSFLNKGIDFKRGPSLNMGNKKQPQHFHRPDEFSYRKVRSDIVKPTKSGMLTSSLGNKQPSASFRQPPYRPIKSQEPIQLAKLPDAQKTSQQRQPPVERDDFVAPPEPAAIYPELLRERRHLLRSKSLPGDTVDGSDNKENEAEEDEIVRVDPRVERDIDELSKISGSGTARLFLEELKKTKLEPPKLDPRNSSRSPSATVEPLKKIRYESSVFASPSRDLRRARPWQYDDSLAQKYRTCASPSVPRPGYRFKSRTIDPRLECMSAMAVRSNTLDSRLEQRTPTSGWKSATLDNRYGCGYASDTTDGYFPSNYQFYHRRPESSSAAVERSEDEFQSDVEDRDPNTGLRITRNSHIRSSYHGRLTPNPYASLWRNARRIFKDVEETRVQIYPYETLRLDTPSRPPGLDDRNLELHLDEADFEKLFSATKEEFMAFPEWKRNDLKQRVKLF